MMHKVELLAVGTELLLGNILNSNAQYLSQQLSALGLGVYWHTVVGDNPGRLSQALEVARNRADIIITTGGLGPTYDDMTKETICQVFGKELVRNEEAAAYLTHYFNHVLHIELTPNNFRQAELPLDCMVFDNPVGTAPGCAFCVDDTHVIMLPGPPHECNHMYHRHVVPYLQGLSDGVIVSHDIMTFGIGESIVDDRLQPWMSQLENPTLATYAKPTEVRLRATAKADTAAQAEAMLEPIIAQVEAVLGKYVYGIDVESLEQACVTALQEAGATLASAESCTGGQIAQRITAIPGASRVYRGGVVSYWSELKAAVLGVPQELLDTYGAVSEQVACAMAQGARQISGATYGIATTGVAGPDKDERGNDVGVVYVALDGPNGTQCRKLELGKRPRGRIQELATKHAINTVRKAVKLQKKTSF